MGTTNWKNALKSSLLRLAIIDDVSLCAATVMKTLDAAGFQSDARHTIMQGRSSMCGNYLSLNFEHEVQRMVLCKIVCLLTLALIGNPALLCGAEPPTIRDVPFQALHKLISPRQGESRWMEIDWYPTVWEARKKAAVEGKPIFLMAGSGGAPTAGC